MRNPEGFGERTYRSAVARQRGWSAFTVRYRETDLLIQSDKALDRAAERAVLEARMQVEGYARRHPSFLSAHAPLPLDPLAPPVVREMLEGGKAAGVGPMAAVAGSIAQHVGERLLQECEEVVVENGGDLYLHAKRCLTVGIFAGASPLSFRVGLRIQPEEMPLGLGTSSATVGHSWSYGKADAACVVGHGAALADAAATALCNRVRRVDEMEEALAWVLGLGGVRGALVILGERMAVQGRLEITALGHDQSSKA